MCGSKRMPEGVKACLKVLGPALDGVARGCWGLPWMGLPEGVGACLGWGCPRVLGPALDGGDSGLWDGVNLSWVAPGRVERLGDHATVSNRAWHYWSRTQVAARAETITGYMARARSDPGRAL